MNHRLPGQARLCAAALFIFLLPAPALAANQAQAASAQFARAEKLRDSLSSRQTRKRRDYQHVIDAYRRVYYLDPGSSKAPASVAAVAQLLAEIGRQFDDPKMLRAAIGQYKFLRREYPGSRERIDALFTIAQIYQDDLQDSAQAKTTYQEFLKYYPRSARADDARKALAALNPSEEQEPVEKTEAKSPAADNSGLARVRRVRYWSTPDSTRVAIDLDSDVTFRSERLENPDRVVFDLHWTRLAPGLSNQVFKVNDGLLKKIRVGEYKPGTARVVLEVQDISKYSAFLLPNPDRLIIDVRGRQSGLARKPGPSRGGSATGTIAQDGRSEVTLKPAAATAQVNPPPSTSAKEKTESRPKPDSATNPGAKAAVRIITDDETNQRAMALPPSVKRPSRVVIEEGGAKVEAHEARPTASGGRSLIRALGLKIGKIVIDPGHGGHDTGTIGPHGLEEKDLVLDVGLRLGRLLEQRLGADVVYTREDDTFVPLETRTAIANQEQADLFISIHANSSHDPGARGVETYYLNFTTSHDALEVAARENAVSDQSIYQLQELVKTITLQEKVEESREFAADVQHALYAGLAGRGSAIRNRGVKKAPFVVLIGARMPSILAEISFVSNPQDERKLRSSAYRQRIAQALYRGVTQYADGLSGIKVASSAAQGDGQ